MPAGLKLVNLKRFPENSVVKWLGSIYKWLPPSAFQAKQTVLISYRCIWRGSLTQYPLGSPRKYDSSHDVLTHLILLIELHSSNGFICLDVLKRIGNKNQHMHQMVPWWWFTVVQVKKITLNKSRSSESFHDHKTMHHNNQQAAGRARQVPIKHNQATESSLPQNNGEHRSPEVAPCKWSGLQSGQIRIPKPELTGFGGGFPY